MKLEHFKLNTELSISKIYKVGLVYYHILVSMGSILM
jgi:hypothetical protein